MRKIIFAALSLFFGALFLEVISLGVLLVMKTRWNHAFNFDAKEFLGQLDAKSYEEHYKSFDPLLGWKEPPGIQRSEEFGHHYSATIENDGARRNPQKPRTLTKIVTYGDSFAKGDGVDDDKTFQYYLSAKSGATVLNFGVSGYGPDQAVLNYKNRNGLGSQAAILMVMSENIRRASNHFRKFYLPASSVFPGFKPMILLEKNSMSLLDVPNLEPGLNKKDLSDKIQKAKNIDPWANIRVKVTPPFTFAVLKLLFNQLAVENNNVDLQRLVDYPGWENPDSVKILEFWISEFHRIATQRKEIALVVFIPQGVDFARPPYTKFLKQNMTKRLFVDFSEVAGEKSPGDVYLHPKSGHLNPEGNKILADMVFEKIGPYLK